MARGYENKKIVDDYMKDIQGALDFLTTIIPCIIPDSPEDGELLNKGHKTIVQLNKFIKDCDGDLSKLDELFNIDAIVEDYPSIREMFRSTSHKDRDDVTTKYMNEERYGG